MSRKEPRARPVTWHVVQRPVTKQTGKRRYEEVVKLRNNEGDDPHRRVLRGQAKIEIETKEYRQNVFQGPREPL